MKSRTDGADSPARALADPMDGGISDAELNSLYDRLLKTNPDFARREAAAEAAKANNLDGRAADRSRSAVRDL